MGDPENATTRSIDPVCQPRVHVHGLAKKKKPLRLRLRARPERSPATKSTCSDRACALARSTKKHRDQVTVRPFYLL